MYEKACSTCNQKIRMEQINGKWGAYELGTNDYHKCGEDKKTAPPQKEPKNQLKNLLEASLALEALDARVTKLEQIVMGPRK